MTYAALKAAMPTSWTLINRPLCQISLCPDCGEFYRNGSPVWCRESQGMEWVERGCPTWECRESREVGK